MDGSSIDQRSHRVMARIAAVALGATALLLAALGTLLMIAISEEYGMTTGDALFGAAIFAVAIAIGYLARRLWRR